MSVEDQIENIKRDWHKVWMTAPNLWIIHETADGYYQVEHHAVDGVGPPTRYNTKRQAVARLLQLLACGPVAPQTWPEEICVGNVDAETDEVERDSIGEAMKKTFTETRDNIRAARERQLREAGDINAEMLAMLHRILPLIDGHSAFSDVWTLINKAEGRK